MATKIITNLQEYVNYQKRMKELKVSLEKSSNQTEEEIKKLYDNNFREEIDKIAIPFTQEFFEGKFQEGESLLAPWKGSCSFGFYVSGAKKAGKIVYDQVIVVDDGNKGRYTVDAPLGVDLWKGLAKKLERNFIDFTKESGFDQVDIISPYSVYSFATIQFRI